LQTSDTLLLDLTSDLQQHNQQHPQQQPTGLLPSPTLDLWQQLGSQQ
jgi:hypothetical protein